MAIITTPTMKQIDFAKHMLEITSITTVAYGDPTKAKEVQAILESIEGVTLHIGGTPLPQDQSVEKPQLPSSFPHKTHDSGREK